jgi:hypothetical protein
MIFACAWVMLGSAAIHWPGTESQGYLSNRSRLDRMTLNQRRETWQKYQEFLALPQAERDRIRRLNADLQKLPTEKRERYRGMMDRYMKWKHTLPLYQQHMLEAAAAKGSNELYVKFREVQARKENEDRQREYWFVPDGPPGIRKAIPRILARLSPDEIEELDQTPPLDRTEKLLAAAQRVGLDVPVPGGPGALARQWLRGPLPPPDPDKFQKWLQTLPREQLEELGDLGPMKNKARERQLFQFYYRQHPEEYRARLRKLDGGGPDALRPNDRMPRPKGPEGGLPPEPPDRGDRAKTPGKSA